MKFPSVNMSASWFLVSKCWILILESKLILSNDQSKRNFVGLVNIIVAHEEARSPRSNCSDSLSSPKVIGCICCVRAKRQVSTEAVDASAKHERFG